MLASSSRFFLFDALTKAFGFGPGRRLHFHWEYQRFFNKSEVFRLSECIIFRIPNDLGHFRLGMTFKTRGSSIERNRVKRQIRESFRILGPQLGSFDYNVVVPKHKKIAHPYANRLGSCLKGQLCHVFPKSS